MLGSSSQYRSILLSLGATIVAFALTVALNPWQFPWGFSTDAEAYLGHAHQLLHDGAFNMGPQSINSFVTEKFLPAGTPNFYTPPAYIAMLAAGLTVWDSWQVALAENAIFFALTVYLGLRILSWQGEKRFLRLAFTCAMVLDPAYLLYNGGVQLDTPAAMLTCAFILLWLKALDENRFTIFTAAGLCGAAACLTRGNMLPVIGVMGLLAPVGHFAILDRKKVAGIALTGLVGALLLGGWAWRTEQITGRWNPTGSGNPGYMMELNYSLTGPRASVIRTVWSRKGATAHIRMLAARGDAPLKIEAEMDQELSHQVMAYIANHKLWATRIFAVSNVRLFLASEFSQPQLIASRLGGGPVVRTAANLYVFGSRGLLLAAFLAFPWLMWRGLVALEFSWIWCATLAFVLLTAFVAPGADRYRLPIEPLCAMYVVLWAAHLRSRAA